MKSSLAIIALSTLGTCALPHTAKRDTTPISSGSNDTTILNYALTLENLGSAFYTEALAKFDEQAFNSSGFSPAVRERFVIVNEEEKASVAVLNQVLGENATLPCNYSFPYTDVPSFVNLSQIIESIGASAYVGLLENITNTTNFNGTGTGQSNSSLPNNSTWDGAPITPLTPRQVLTLIAPYITSCPSTNSTLPFTTFPALTVSPGQPGSAVTFTFDSSATPNGTSPSGNPSPPEPSITIVSSLIPTSIPSETGTFPTGVIPSNSATSLTGTTSSDPASPVSTVLSSRDVTSSNETGGTVSSNGTTLFAAFLSGQGTQFVPMGDGNNVTIPGDLVGQVYAMVTTSDTAATDDTIVAGPTVLDFGSVAQGNGTSMNQ